MPKDPLIHQYRIAYIRPMLSLLIVIIALYIFALLLTNLLDMKNFLSVIPWQLIFVLLLILSSLYYMGLRVKWNRRTALRTHALSADPAVLATSQPTPNPHYILALPATILLQPDFKKVRNPIMRALILLIVIFSAIFFICFQIFPPNIYFPLCAFIILITLPALLLWISNLRKARSLLSQQRIEATEQGLTVSYQGKTSSITWQDARLFTISDFHQKHLPLFYELSGKKTSLLWMQALPNKPLLLHQYLAPIIPFEEYTYQMQALHALIIARTQLPLYNLSTTTQTTPPPTITNPQ